MEKRDLLRLLQGGGVDVVFFLVHSLRERERQRERERERESFMRNNVHNGVVSGAARWQALHGPMQALHGPMTGVT